MRTMGRAARREFELRYTAETNHDFLMDIYRLAMQEPPVVYDDRDRQTELVTASNLDLR